MKYSEKLADLKNLWKKHKTDYHKINVLYKAYLLKCKANKDTINIEEAKRAYIEAALECNLIASAICLYNEKNDLKELQDLLDDKLAEGSYESLDPAENILLQLVRWKQSNEKSCKAIIQEQMRCLSDRSYAEQFISIKNVSDLITQRCPELFDRLYTKILLCVKEAFDIDVIRRVEGYHRNRMIDCDELSDYDSKLVAEYYYSIMESDAVIAFRYLSKLSKLDSSKQLGISKDQYYDYLAIQNKPEFVYYLLKHYKNDEENLNPLVKWFEHVMDKNQNSTIILWCRWVYIFQSMQEYIMSDTASEGSFYDCFSYILKLDLYPFNETDSIIKPAAALSGVFNLFVIKQWDIKRFLEFLGHYNILEYEYRVHYIYCPQKLQILPTNPEAETLLLQSNYEIEELIAIYMNTHFRFYIDIRVLVEWIAEKVNKCTSDPIDELNLSEYFSQYPIDGSISKINEKSTARDKFHLEPTKVKTKYTYRYATEQRIKMQENMKGDKLGSADVKKQKELYNKTIKIDEKWFRENETEVLKFREASVCEFNLYKYIQSSGVLLAHNVSCKQILEYDFASDLDKVLDWMKQIQLSKEVKKIDEDERMLIITKPYTVDKSRIFAETIFETAWSLRDDYNKIHSFFLLTSIGNLDKINEYQYIPKSVSTQLFRIPQNEFKAYLAEAEKKVADLINCQTLTCSQKINIFMNTYIKTCYSLDKFLFMVLPEGDTLDVRTEMKSFLHMDNEFDQYLFPVVFEKEVDGILYFSLYRRMKYRTLFKFAYTGSSVISKDQVYYVDMKEIDYKNRCFICGHIYTNEQMSNDIWKKYIGKIHDLKRNFKISNLKRTAFEIGEFSINFQKGNRIERFSRELNQLFRTWNYSAEVGVEILNTIRQNNPYISNAIDDAIVFSQEEAGMYKAACWSMLEEAVLEGSCNINILRMFEESYFKFVVDRDEFYQRLSEQKPHINIQQLKEEYANYNVFISRN